MKMVNKRGLNIVARWGPAIICMAVIFYFSHQPGSTLVKIMPYFNKIFPHMASFNWGHFVAYFILALTVYWGLVGRTRPIIGKVLTVIICTLYGVTDEYHQLYVEGRHFDLLDIRNDAIGALLAMLFISIRPISKWYLKLSNMCNDCVK